MQTTGVWKPRPDLPRGGRGRLMAAIARLWFHLSHRKLAGLAFERHYPVMIDDATGFVADIVHADAGVIIEIDEGYPADRARARALAIRDAKCLEAGWRIIRLWRPELEQNLDGCLLQIRFAVESRLNADRNGPRNQPRTETRTEPHNEPHNEPR